MLEMIRRLNTKSLQACSRWSKQRLCHRQLFSTSVDRLNFFGRAWMGFKHLTGQIPPTKREQIELEELRLALMSIHCRRYDEDHPNQLHEKELSKIWEENKRLKNVGLRYEVQVELVPEILELFNTFQQVDKQLDSSQKQIDMVLFQDYEDVKLRRFDYG